MDITYYQYTAEKNRIDKSGYMSQIGSASGVPVDAVDIVSPSVLIHAAVPSYANYAYVDTFDCYYWITEITRDTDTQTVLLLRRDPLMSFKDYILGCPCVCDRTAKQSKGTFYVDDPTLRTNQYTLNETKSFGVGMFDYNGRTLLMTVG